MQIDGIYCRVPELKTKAVTTVDRTGLAPPPPRDGPAENDRKELGQCQTN